MALNSLLMTQDSTLLEVIRNGFRAANIELEMRTDATSALELATRRHLDSFVIDCDGVPQATELLSQIRRSRSNGLSIILAVDISSTGKRVDHRARSLDPVSEGKIHVSEPAYRIS